MRQTVTTRGGSRTTHKLRELFEVLRDTDEHMPIQWALAFLAIASGWESNDLKRPSDIQAYLNTSSASATRITQGLAAVSWTGKPGLDLIVQVPDERDARARVFSLTPRGQRLWDRLQGIMEV